MARAALRPALRQAIHRGALPNADVPQAYLLGDMSTYSTSANPGVLSTIGREFRVLSAARCYGVRMKHPYTATIGIRLYRVEDHALLASKDGLSITADTVTELLFDSPVALSTSEAYVIAYYDGTNLNFYRRASADHPAGAVTWLTYHTINSWTGDVFPQGLGVSTSWAGEPIIYATASEGAVATAVVPLTDTFSGSGALHGRTPDTAGNAWANLNGKFGDIASGRATYLNAADGEHGVAIVNCATGNCEIISTMMGRSSVSGLVCRSNVNGSSRTLIVPNLEAIQRLDRYVYTALETGSSVANSGASSISWTAGDDHIMTILLRETLMRVLIDGALEWSQYPIGNADRGYHGIGTFGRGWFNDNVWDSIQVRALTGWKDIMVIGDSISAASGLGADLTMWPLVLAGLYNGARTWPINLAIGAGHIVSGIGHMSDQVAEGAFFDPDYIIIEMGTNDSGTIGSNEAAYEADLLQLHADHPGVPIYACTVLNCTTLSEANRNAINAEITSAVADAATAGVNVTLWDTEGWIDPATDTSDGVHPNTAGHAKIAAAMLALLP